MPQAHESYTLGLDIGIASVGWCVLGEKRIIDLGVRAFDKAETADKGEPLNLARRQARLLRHRLQHRALRLKKLARLLRDNGLIASSQFFRPNNPTSVSPWHLRVEGLNRVLTPEEWARVIYHLVKHRGFHWASLAEEKTAETDSKREGGKVTKALSTTKSLIADYDTAALMVMTEFVKPYKDENGNVVLDINGKPVTEGSARNKAGDYGKSLSRVLLADELSKLFDSQRKLDNPYASTNLEKEILGNGNRKSGIFWLQKPALSGEQLLAMLGRCTFEKTGGTDGKGEYRAPKASFTAERHVWLTRLNNLRIVVDGVTRPLNEAERTVALPLPYKYEKGELKYKQLGMALVSEGCLIERSFKFGGLAYPSERQKVEDKAKDPEDGFLVKLPGWRDLHKKLKDHGLETEWQGMAGAAADGRPELLDSIAWVLSVYKEDVEIRSQLAKLSLPNADKTIGALCELSFKEFHALSLKALRKIVPLMENGTRYDEAVTQIPEYGHHSHLHGSEDDKEEYLPPLYEQHRGKEPGQWNKMLLNERIDREIPGGIPRNPVVLRALNQARKVVNALVRHYRCSPTAVHIEMARDLSHPLEERNAISKEQEAYRARNENDWEEFRRLAPQMGWRESGKPKGADFEKWQLYREQQGKSIYPTVPDDQGVCAYSFAPIDLNRLLEAGYVEVDHALPYARSFDDSKHNKVLVLKKQNQDKGDRTPYEYLTTLDGEENGPRWRQFVAFVENNKPYRQAKKNRLLRKDFDDKAAANFRERNLNDTRYICRFFKSYVERYLRLDKNSPYQRPVVVSGALTSLLRARWGLPSSKEKRKANDRHHAMDAAVIAASGHQVVKRLSTFVNEEGWAHKPELGGYVQMETGEILSTKDFIRKDSVYKLFPKPWKHFRDELLARLNTDEPAKLREEMERLGTYPPEALKTLRPLFVSRAPQRRNSGAAHKATVYAKPRLGHKLTVKDKESKALRNATEKEMAGLVIERIGVLDRDVKGNYKLTMDKLESIIDPERNQIMVHALRLWLSARDEREKQAKTIEISLGRGKEKRALTKEEQVKLEELRALPRKPRKEDPDDGPFTGPIIRTVKLNAGKTSGIDIRDGIATNEAMLRVDVFRHKDDRKYHLVPLYVHHTGAKELPNRAIIQAKDESDWTVIDNNFDFCFSLYQNDLIRITQRSGEVVFGYYRNCHTGTGAVNLALHDRHALGEKTTSLVFRKKNPDKQIPNDKRGLIEGVGVKIAANIEKFHVDVLGNIYPAPSESRRGLA